ncbi:MAG: hypothetical protein K1X83_00510 [Oligoflexia bacterium]|nr:hypothetical protein [Oligoflexia bacterium]
MKKGCAFLLLIWIAAGAGYFYFLRTTQYADRWWLPILLGLLFAIVIANLQGILLALKQRGASKKSPREWRDGELVGFSGRIQAVRSPLTAPFSGRAAVIVEYDIKHAVRSENNSTDKVSDFMGMLMTPCTVQSSRGQMKMVGFPLLSESYSEHFEEEAHYARAAKYLLTTAFKPRGKNPLTLLKELNEILTDDDGDVRAEFKASDSIISAEEDLDAGAALNRETALAQDLKDRECWLEEKIIAQGAEVTVFGSYLAKKQAINIGGGMQHLSHQIHLGKLEVVLGKQLRKSVIGSVVWLAIFGAVNWYLAKELGLLPGSQ